MASGRLRWWTFAGGAVNSALVLRLGDIGSTRVDDLWVETAMGISVPRLLSSPAVLPIIAAFAQGLAERTELKFSACLPADLLVTVVAGRALD
jgi:hypothetical protein